MKKIFIIVIVAVLIIVIIGGYLGWTYLSSQNQNPDDTTEPVAFSVERIRDGAMLYLSANHTQTLELMNDLSWSGGKEESGLLGAETYVYLSGSWSVVIDYPVVPNPLYTITIDYSSNDVTVNWVGTYVNTTFTETSCTIDPETTVYLTQEQVRDIAMTYLEIYHNETQSYMQSLTWTGGRITPEGLVGSETYSYQSSGWNVTLQYPVVLTPIYTISIDYTAMDAHSTDAIITWAGTINNGVIDETDYEYNP